MCLHKPFYLKIQYSSSDEDYSAMDIEADAVVPLRVITPHYFRGVPLNSLSSYHEKHVNYTNVTPLKHDESGDFEPCHAVVIDRPVFRNWSHLLLR